MKSVKKEVNLLPEYNKKEIKMENNKADFTLKFCCIGACPDQYVADILQTGERQKEKKHFSIDFYSYLRFVSQSFSGSLTSDIRLPVDTNLPLSSSALGYGI